MSETDWWQDLYGESGSLAVSSDDRTDAPGSDPEHGALVGTVSPKNSGTNTSGQSYVPPSAHDWGSGRKPDPFLTENPAHGDKSPRGDTTAEEAAELDRHKKTDPVEEKSESVEEAKNPDIPPKPTEPPTVGITEEEAKGVKELLKIFKEKKEGKTRREAAKDATKSGIKKVADKTEPARKVAHTAGTAVSASFSGGWSFLWSLAAAWTIPVTFPVALLDRIAMIFGSPRPLSGTERMDWNFLHGPGMWFSDQLEAYGASGNIGRMAMLAAIGVVPVLFSQFGEKIASPLLRKLGGWIAYGFPVFFICMPSYSQTLGFHSTEDLYITALAASTWWGFTFSRTLNPGFCQFLLRIPLAAVIVGLGHYAPGAAF